MSKGFTGMSAVESTDVSCGSVARLKNQENLRKLAVREDVGFVSVERPYSLTISCRNQSRRKEERKKKGRSDEEQLPCEQSYREQSTGRVAAAAPNVWPGRTEEGSVRYWYCSTVRQVTSFRKGIPFQKEK